ncbi:unnamed protein product [Caenorhabditis auriculariae]|uniref:Uncharacterized protein n=1 Tax=Caenorhabditis auriculariae TaxID=2777116 RepID=A0A8S1H5H3_9PELO|nr:unnamed protein product [Caenorhabditis auriculariae]
MSRCLHNPEKSHRPISTRFQRISIADLPPATPCYVILWPDQSGGHRRRPRRGPTAMGGRFGLHRIKASPTTGFNAEQQHLLN